jgi:hypothetical protein
MVTGTPLRGLGAYLRSNGATLRALNAVMRYGTYQTIEQVDAASDEDLLDRRNLGYTGLTELRDAIRVWKRDEKATGGNQLTDLDIREEHDSASTILVIALEPDGRNYHGLSLPVLARSAADALAAARAVWVATEFSIDDGGRAWIQAASTCETAKRLCVEHLNRDGDPTNPRTLTWSDDRGAKWMFGQDTEAARVDGHDYYGVRRVEVTD